MNKQQYLVALDELVTNAFDKSWQQNQDDMIEDFRIQEEDRMELFNDNEDVGFQEELLEIAQRFQGNWSYKNNRHLDPIF